MRTLIAALLAAGLMMNSGNAAGGNAKTGWTPEKWAACKDGSVMIKALKGQVRWPGDKERQPLVLASCECARLALQYLPKDDTRARQAIEAVELTASKEGSSVDPARNVFGDLLGAVAYLSVPDGVAIRVVASAYISVAYAAASATIDYAEDAVEAAAYSMERSADAVESATRNPDDRARVLVSCADIVRSHFPNPPAKPGR